MQFSFFTWVGVWMFFRQRSYCFAMMDLFFPILFIQSVGNEMHKQNARGAERTAQISAGGEA